MSEFELVTDLAAIQIAPLLSSKTWMHVSPKSGNGKRHTDRRKKCLLQAFSPCVLEIHWVAAPPHMTAAPETGFLFVSLGA